ATTQTSGPIRKMIMSASAGPARTPAFRPPLQAPVRRGDRASDDRPSVRAASGMPTPRRIARYGCLEARTALVEEKQPIERQADSHHVADASGGRLGGIVAHDQR